MEYKERQNNRGSIRLLNYDYAQAGAYFVAICTHERICLFGDAVVETMKLNDLGQIVYDEWMRTAEIRLNIRLDTFQVMPNHFHAIVIFPEQLPGKPTVGAHSGAPLSRQARSLGSLVAGFKSVTTKRINQMRNTPGVSVWQRNYYERVIRNDEELAAIGQYIADNPAKWAEDIENPQNWRRQR